MGTNIDTNPTGGFHAFIPADASVEVTIISVVFDNAAFLLQNAAFLEHFNPDDLPRWIVVDNSPEPLSWPELPPHMEVLVGEPARDGKDRGSLHHALALENGLKHASTRYVLLMDADFYVVRDQWLRDLAQHVSRQHLALFGSVWHPRWYYQYRYFPSVHFLWIDGAQIPLDSIDLKPRIRTDLWWRFINDERWPVPFRKTLKATRIRDTGWALFHQHRRNPRIAYECLTPHFVADRSRRERLEAALRPFWPESLCLYPKEQSCYTAETFLRDGFPDGFAAGWEEFFWHHRPFAFHLRQIGRRMLGRSTETDLDSVRRAFRALSQ